MNDDDPIVSVGALRFNRDTGALCDDLDRAVALRPQSLSVLKALVARQGQVADRETLIAEVWGSVNVTDDSLIQCIADIRRAIGDDKHKIVQTVPKKGYRLVAAAAAMSRLPFWTRLWLVTFVASALALLVALVGIWTYLNVGETGADHSTIAVLPFQNMSDDAGQVYFADGMAEDIITDLSKISGLLVIARNSSFQFRGGAQDLKLIASKLGVRYILEGSVRRAADRVRVNAQLIDTNTGGHVWAERYDGKLADVFSLQDDITGRIIDALELELTSTEKTAVARKDTKNARAYDAYLRGLSLLSSRRRQEFQSNRAAQDEFKKAIAIDPDYALAIAGLAWAKWLQINTIYPFQSTDEVYALAERSVVIKENALAYRVLATRHFSLQTGWVWTTRISKLAVVELEKARVLEPNNPDVLADLAAALCFAGDPERALVLITRARKLNPDHPKWYFAASGIARLLLGKPARAVQDLRAWSHDFRNWRPPYLFLAAALAGSGEIDAAKAAVARHDNLYDVGTTTSLYAVRKRWPMAPEQQEIFQRGLSLAGMKEPRG